MVPKYLHWLSIVGVSPPSGQKYKWLSFITSALSSDIDTKNVVIRLALSQLEWLKSCVYHRNVCLSDDKWVIWPHRGRTLDLALPPTAYAVAAVPRQVVFCFSCIQANNKHTG